MSLRRSPSDLPRVLTVLVCGAALAATVAMVVSRLVVPSDGMLIQTDAWPWTSDGVAVRPMTTDSPIRDGDVVVAVDGRSLADWASEAVAPPWVLATRPVGPNLAVTVRRDGALVRLAVPRHDTFANRLGGAPIGLVIFGAGALIVALTLVLRRPQATAIRLLFVGVCCNTADIVAWETGLQPTDLVARTPFLYAFALAAIGNLLFWSCLIHLLSIYPVRAGWLARRPGDARLIYALPLVALAAGAVGTRLLGDSILVWFDRLGTVIALIVSAMIVTILGSIVAGYRRTPVPRRRPVRLLAVTLGIAATASLLLTSLPIAILDHPLLARGAVAIFAIPVIVALALAVIRDRLFQVDLLATSRRRIVAAREEERMRLRRELHDGLGPTLAALGLKVDRARAEAEADPTAVRATLDEIRTDLRAALAQIRSLARELRPPGLDALGLVDSLRQQLATIGGSSGPAVEIIAADIGPIPPAIEVAAYRIVIEAVTNAVRHSGATRCSVEIVRERRALAVRIHDNGSGISGGPIGVGTRSMYERAAEVGGELLIEPAPEGGTVVSASLPLTTQAAASVTMPTDAGPSRSTDRIESVTGS